MRGLLSPAGAMRAAVSRCCRTPPVLLSVRTAAHSPSAQLHQAVNQKNDLLLSTFYVLDLLPLVYRYLPREQPATGLQPAALGATISSDAQQQPTDPAEEFLGTLLALTRRNQNPPTHLAVAVDVPGATYRHRMYPQYKAQRQPHPPALTEAVSRILAVVDALGIPILAVPGVEADDVVGTLAVKAERDGFGSVVIMSIDKDFYQLLSPTVSVMQAAGAYADLYTLQSFRAEQQLPDPKLWIDVKALMGDPSDNIPGIRSVGAKTAKQLVQSFGTVEQISQQLAGMPEAQQQQVVKLNKTQRAMLLSEEGRVAAAFMKELVTIHTDLKAPPCQRAWSAYELKVPPDGGKAALEAAQKLGMQWLSQKLAEYFQRLAA